MMSLTMPPGAPFEALQPLLDAIGQQVIDSARAEWHRIPLERRANLADADALVIVFGRALALALACVGREPNDRRSHPLEWHQFLVKSLRQINIRARHDRDELDELPSHF